jgi:hypothetical protein
MGRAKGAGRPRLQDCPFECGNCPIRSACGRPRNYSGRALEPPGGLSCLVFVAALGFNQAPAARAGCTGKGSTSAASCHAAKSCSASSMACRPIAVRLATSKFLVVAETMASSINFLKHVLDQRWRGAEDFSRVPR